MVAPIIASLLDNDFYNFTMGQMAWKYFPNVRVTYALSNRSVNIKLGRLVNARALRQEIDRVRELTFSAAHLAYLRSLDLFEEGYLRFLADLRLPQVSVQVAGDQLKVTYEGLWAAAIFWETPLLAIINELTNRARIADRAMSLPIGRANLTSDIATLCANLQIHVMEFGTRRRASFRWQQAGWGQLQATVPNQLVGTSNVELAMQLGLQPKGTLAHQAPMVTTALQRAAGAAHPIAASQAQLIRLWEDLYGKLRNGELLTWLPDTYGTPTSLDLFTPEQAARWNMRQDSGDPFEIGDIIVAFWERLGVDPMSRRLLPSDGLTLDLAIRLEEHFRGRTQADTFGIGTYLTNRVGVPPVSIVIKAMAANGHPTGKITDNRRKAVGDADTLALLEAEAGYYADYAVQPTV